MFVFEGLKQTQEDRVEVQHDDGSGLILSVLFDEPDALHVRLLFKETVFFSRSIFPGPNGVNCDLSHYELGLGYVRKLENSDLAAEYTTYYSRQLHIAQRFEHFIIIFDGVGTIFHVIAQSVEKVLVDTNTTAQYS